MLLALSIPLLSACADLTYLHQAARGHLSLLWNARPVAQVIDDPATTPRLMEQLRAAQSIRRFAVEQLALPDNRSYTQYSDTGQRYAVWNILATEPLSLKLESFCFPVTGCLNYKGFYAEADAQAYAVQLRSRGLEVAVAGVPAYSTLGWTPDPLLNTFIFYPKGELARLIFHELAHQTLYIADDTAFNESFATAVEELGVQLWLQAQGDATLAAEYAQFDARRREFQDLLMSTRENLRTVFDSDLSETEKRAGRDRVFDQAQDAYKSLRDGPWQGYAGYDRFFKEELSTPRLAGFGLYRAHVPAFKSLFEQSGRDFRRFYESAARLGRLDRSTRQQRLAAMENPELACAVLLPNLVVGQRSGCDDGDPVLRTGQF